jgi:regulator of replication initiation timing
MTKATITSCPATTQTDLDSEQLAELAAHSATLETRINALLESNSQLSELVTDLTAKLADSERSLQNTQTPIEHTVPLQSTGELAELREKLEATQQLNLKLKAKVKQLLAQSKATADVPSTTNVEHEASGSTREVVNQRLVEENAHLVTQLAGLASERNDLLTQLESLNRECAELKQNNSGLIGEKDFLAMELAELRQMQFEAEMSLTSVREDSARALRQACEQLDTVNSNLEAVTVAKNRLEERLAELEGQLTLVGQSEVAKPSSVEFECQVESEPASRDEDLQLIQSLRDSYKVLADELDQFKSTTSSSVLQLEEVKSELEKQVVDLGAQLSVFLTPKSCDDFGCQVESERSEDQLLIQSLRDANNVLANEIEQLKATAASTVHGDALDENLSVVQSLRDANTLLNLELDQYRKFKMESEAYISNLLSDYNKLSVLVNQERVDVECQTDEDENEEKKQQQLVQELTQYRQFKVRFYF